MKLARTIRLDVSDANVFPLAATPGEWAVTGTFAFADADPDGWDGKHKIAFRDGWLGTESFGRSTFVQVTTITAEHYEATMRHLAAHIFEAYGAPGMLEALAAARHEIDDMARLCDHSVGTLLAMERRADETSITERTRIVTPPSEEFHTRIWSIEDDAPDPGPEKAPHMYKRDEARRMIFHAWRDWPGKTQSPNGNDALAFFSYLENEKPHLLQFRSRAGKWPDVHGWLIRNGDVSD